MAHRQYEGEMAFPRESYFDEEDARGQEYEDGARLDEASARGLIPPPPSPKEYTPEERARLTHEWMVTIGRA